MSKREQRLKGGIDALFNGASTRAVEPEQEEVVTTPQEEAIDTVQDEELKAALRERVLLGRGRPKRGRKKDSKTEGYTTICVKANIEKWEKIEYIALHETLQKKEVLELAMDMLIEKYESEKGTIKIKKQNKKGNVFNKE
jgi:hypothetical protein